MFDIKYQVDSPDIQMKLTGCQAGVLGCLLPVKSYVLVVLTSKVPNMADSLQLSPPNADTGPRARLEKSGKLK